MHAALLLTATDISQFIAQACIAGLWQGVVLISAAAIFLRFVPRVGAAVRFAIWVFVFTLAAAMPLLHLPPVPVRGAHAASAMVHLGVGWGFAIAALWALFMLVRAAQLLVHTMHLRRIWRRAQPVPVEDPIPALLQRSGRRTVELCTSPDVDSPSVIGFFSPRLLIPEWLFAKLAPSDLQQIVLHECEHLRRWDDWINLLQKIALALFPLNPALLWVDRRLNLEREMACDAGVVASTTAPFEYAHCLTRLAEQRLHRRSVALSLSAWSRQSELARRVHHLLRPTRHISRVQARISIALICLGLGIGAIQMAKAPRLFSFTDAAIPPPVAEATGTMPTPTPNTISSSISSPAATSPTAAHELPVVYRQAAQPRPVLVNAVLTSQKPPSAAHKATFETHSRPSRRHIRTPKPYRQPRVILTTFEIQSTAPAYNARFNNNIQPIAVSPSYAAVPFGDGWLVIQL